MSGNAARQTAWTALFTPEDVNLARRLYEAWRQAIIDWGVKTPPTWSEMCESPGDDGVKPWLAVASAAAQPHAMCGRSLSGGELLNDQCCVRHRGHTCNRFLHPGGMHYCSCLYSWPVTPAGAPAALPVEVRS